MTVKAEFMPKAQQTDSGKSSAGLISRLAYARAVEQGVEVRGLLQRAGLSIATIEDADARISVAAQVKFLDLVARQPDRAGLPVERDFIEARPMDDQSFANAHRRQRLSDPAKHFRVGDSEQLHGRTRGIDAGTQQIHDRPHLELATNQPGMLHSRVVGRCEQEAKAGLVEQFARLVRRGLDLRSERLDHVGRAAARADAAIAMLGDRQPTGGGDKRRGGGDVDEAGTVAARAAAIGIEIVGTIERQRRGAQGPGGPDHFVRRLALHPKRDQHAGNLGRLELAEHQPLEQMLRILGRQVLPVEQFWQRVCDRLKRIVGVAVFVKRERSDSGLAGKSQNLVHGSPETKKPAGWRAGSR